MKMGLKVDELDFKKYQRTEHKESQTPSDILSGSSLSTVDNAFTLGHQVLSERKKI